MTLLHKQDMQGRLLKLLDDNLEVEVEAVGDKVICRTPESSRIKTIAALTQLIEAYTEDRVKDWEYALRDVAALARSISDNSSGISWVDVADVDRIVEEKIEQLNSKETTVSIPTTGMPGVTYKVNQANKRSKYE